MSDFESRLNDFQHSIERALDNMQNAQKDHNKEVSEKLDGLTEDTKRLVVQTTKTNGRVSVHSMILYPIAGAMLLLIGALLEKGVISIDLFK